METYKKINLALTGFGLFLMFGGIYLFETGSHTQADLGVLGLVGALYIIKAQEWLIEFWEDRGVEE